MTAEPEDDHPHQGHDEAEDGDKHHPGHWVVWKNVLGSHQDPHQAAKHLQGAEWKESLVKTKEYVNVVKSALNFHSFNNKTL